MKLAVTAFAAVMVTLQVPIPEHPLPLQPANLEFADGEAAKVTTVLLPKDAKQVEPQVMPAGLLVTVPLPAPVLLTVNAYVINAKLAVTAFAAFIVTLQVPIPEHPLPLQPVNVEPVDAAAVKVTAVL